MQDPTSSLTQLLKALPEGAATRATYVKGDRVMVVAGDLNTLEGGLAALRALCCVASAWPRVQAAVAAAAMARHTCG